MISIKRKTMEKEKKLKEKQLAPYIKPSITCIYIEIEDCISSGSARIIPQNANDDIQDEWNVEQDVNENFNW